jgi:serine/threonine protein kinase/Tol biopolymer transport system component
MLLAVGMRLGAFEILSELRAGGMGEVYRAWDTKLHRDVALKVLPEAFANDPERLARFQREARAVAALNHPNIVTIHSVEEFDGLHFLTMELVDGKELGDLIPSGGLPLGTILKLALPLADALNAAHQRGIVHRDLKPGNVMVSAEGRVKILDFGLAKLTQPAPVDRDLSVLTTEQMTAADRVLGTPAYMSPEQAEGKPVDARSDIFSLGVLLYEMAAGDRPFRGGTPFAVISSILKDTPPPLTQVRPDLPADLDRIVHRSLDKEPARRYQTTLDVRDELAALEPQLRAHSAERTFSHAAPGRLAIAAVAVATLVAAITWLVGRAFTTAPDRQPLRATFDHLTSQPGAELFPSLSPDGQWIVYSGEGAGNRDVYLQSVTGQTPINLTIDSPADDEQPAFSPDGERIAFRSSRNGGGLFVMGRTGEAVRRVTQEGFNPAWSPTGTELAYTTVATEFRPQNEEQRGTLMVVPAGGGLPRKLLDRAMLPRWSPSGRRIAFSGGLRGVEGTSNIATVPSAGGAVVPVTRDAFLNWNPAWAPDGLHLFFASNRGGSMNIWRIAIDEASGEPRGEPEAITTPASFAAHLSVSADGRSLAYTAVLETQNIEKLQLDPAKAEVIGDPMPVTTGSRFWANPDPSPDGSQVVFYSQVGPEGDLYVARSDGSRGLRQLTDDRPIDRVPRWSPGGERIAMFSDRSGELHVWSISADGSELRQLTRRSASVVAWSPDGRRLAVTGGTGAPNASTSAIIDAGLPSENNVIAELPPIPRSSFRFVPNSWSPDGQWIAGQNGYTTLGVLVYSVATNTYERVLDFGEWPVWLPDSRHILFVSRGREFHLLDTRTRTNRVIYSSPRDTLGPPRLSRDGRVAFFSRRVTEADVWTSRLSF